MNLKSKQKALRMLSNGIYIITSRNGEHYGAATVTWVSQASFKPPLIMAALRKGSNVFQCLCESRMAALHILSVDQQDVARKFFMTTEVCAGMINGEPFLNGKTCAPILQNAPAYVECRVRRIIEDGGDHAVVILEVVEAECRQDVTPLTIGHTPWEYGG